MRCVFKQEPSMQAQPQTSTTKVSSPAAKASKANSSTQPKPLDVQALRQVGGGVRGPVNNW